MSRTRAFVAANVVVAAILAAGVAFAQAPKPAPAPVTSPSASTSKPSTATRVETWTRKQWAAATAEWAKDKTKWGACQEQSHKQKLEGRKSWSFLYHCMNG